MSGGSGGTNVRFPEDNSLQVEMMRERAAEKERLRQEHEKAQQKRDFETSLSNAVSGARTTGRDYFSSRGLSPDDFSGLLDSIINDTRMKVPTLDANPASYFTTDAFASGLDNYQNLRRANYNSKVNSTFAPGFETSLISDTADDSIINSILNSQRQAAQQQIDFNRKRGVINDAGYATIENELGGQENAARSTLTGIGDSILGKKRQDLLNIRGEAGNAASNYSLGMPEFDVNQYYKRAQDKATTGMGDLEGSIRSALGSTSLFDVPTLLQKGGTAQGPINLTTADASTSLPFDPKKNASKRGLGSTGVF